MKRICRYLPLFVVLLLSMPLIRAQSGFDIAVGFGAEQAKSTGTGLEGNVNSPNFFNTCTTSSSPTCVNTKALSGFTMGVQGNLMLWQHFGVGAEFTTQPAKQDYVIFPQSTVQAGGFNLQSRATLYDFNGIFQPYKSKKANIQLVGGIGGMNLKFYASGNYSDAVLGNQYYSQYYGSSNHFQAHGGLGVTIYLTEHVFLRPEFDVHWVHNLSQFGTNLVTSETVWLGYTLGSQ